MFQLLLLLALFGTVYSSNLTFPILKDNPLKDEPPDSRGGGKVRCLLFLYSSIFQVFLKNRLLDNLNNFFGSESRGALEILASEPQKVEEDVPPSMPIKSTGKIFF